MERAVPRPQTFKHILLPALCLLVVAFFPPGLEAQSELTSSDRLALLYAPQLNFTREGDPIVRVGFLEGQDSIQFTPDRDIRVMPTGEGGPEIELPGQIRYTVTISDSRPGQYTHYVVVDRIDVRQRERAERSIETWTGRGLFPEIVEVGGLFAIAGKVFDSRTLLVAVGKTEKISEARTLRTRLEGQYGVQASIHSQVTRFPGGMITLRGQGINVVIRHRDMLQVVGPPGQETNTRFRVPGIPRFYTSGTDTKDFTGTITFAPDRNGKLVAMTSLGAERLLEGVVPAETFPNAPEHALRAQAIAARNEIFAALGVRNLADPYMLRADVMDQVYGGVGVETRATSAAVAATRGRVMFYDGKIIEAFYSSNAGGHTENNENVWAMEPRPYLRGKPDAPTNQVPANLRNGLQGATIEAFLNSSFPAYSRDAPASSANHYRWTRSVEPAVVQRWLQENGRDIGTIKDAKVLERGHSGRVIRLELTGSKGKTVVERELNVRRLFGGLRSGLFLMDVDRNGRGDITGFRFRGAGFGHGVGMCQTGAIGMAAKGMTFDSILKHYYTGIEIERLY